jgi:LmbE family N-acetylglucosaminyl deacetylase
MLGGKKNIKVLVVGAHPDDFEIGCAGTLLKYKDNIDLKIAVFSDRMDTGEMRSINELDDSIEILGFDRKAVDVYDIPTRIFHDYKSKIRNLLLKLKDSFEPDVIMCPALHDIHQDHIVLAEETIRIFRENSVFGFEVLRSGYGFQPNLHVSLTEEIVNLKIKSAQCYKSQFTTTKSGGFYFSDDVMKGLMFARGGQFGISFAEAFEVYHLKL